jgi:peptidoglycan/LPS O-acetylase OafA/YrhL
LGLSLDFWPVAEEITREAHLVLEIWPVIKAPVAVQLNRIAFALYAAFLGSFLWRIHHTASMEGTAIFLCMFLFSVLGLVSSCIRARRSRWIMAAVGLLIPGIVFIGMCLMEWSRPEGWLEWLFSGLFALVIWFGIPIVLALSLFKDIHSISTDKKQGLMGEIRSAQSCIEYFQGFGTDRPKNVEM